MDLKQFILSLVVILVCTRVMVELAIRIDRKSVV